MVGCCERIPIRPPISNNTKYESDYCGYKKLFVGYKTDLSVTKQTNCWESYMEFLTKNDSNMNPLSLLFRDILSWT